MISKPRPRGLFSRPIWLPWFSVITISIGVFLILGAMFWSNGVVQADGGKCKLDGTVVASPGTATGIGMWQIEGELKDCKSRASAQTYLVQASGTTRFPHGMPQEGDKVKVEGRLVGEAVFQAEEIEREESAEEEKELKLHGWVESRPSSTEGLGTWTVRVTPHQIETVIADASTRFDKGIPEVGQRVEVKGVRQADNTVLAARIRPDHFESDQVIVRLKDGVTPGQLADRHGLILLQSVLPSANIHLFASKDEDEDSLVDILNTQDKDLVVWAELNYVGGVPEGDPYDIWEWGGPDPYSYINQLAFQQIHLPDPMNAITGQNVTVAVLDTGIALAHPEFQGRLALGWDMVDDDPVPEDEPGGLAWGHGTHVAGIVARTAPGSTLLPIRVLDPIGRGNSFVVAYAIEWAVNHGAQVINMSLGGEVDSQVLREAVSWAAEQGVVLVAAAGNKASTVPQYPAAYPDVLAVTAVDQANVKAPFANYGSWVDLAAPGVGITSTLVSNAGYGYASWSGTSMSTAFVSGAAALGRQQKPSASTFQLMEDLRNSAEPLDNVNPIYAGQLGGGLLHVARFLAGSDIPTPTPTPTSTPAPSPTPSPQPSPTPTPGPTPTLPPSYLPIYLPFVTGS